MTSRPTVSVFNHLNPAEVTTSVKMPEVMSVPIRLDIIRFVHDNMARNRKQPHGQYPMAGYEQSAVSWHAGRATARVPRVNGSGTRRASQGAFCNMCRKGRMFAPTKIYRKWQRVINVQQKRHALAAALAATAIPSLVMARGHKIMQLPEVPLVLDNLNIKKTKDMINILAKCGLKEELIRCKKAVKIRSGIAKQRRRYRRAKGPLIIHNSEENECIKAARNIPGLESLNVHAMNLLKIAPGGQLGRCIIWTQSAFKELNHVFKNEKEGYLFQENVISNPDISKIINSNEIQTTLKPKEKLVRTHFNQKKNPLENKKMMKFLNPYHEIRIKAEKQLEELRKEQRASKKKELRKLQKEGRKWMMEIKSSLKESMKVIPKEKEIEPEMKEEEAFEAASSESEEEVKEEEKVEEEKVEKKGRKKKEAKEAKDAKEAKEVKKEAKKEEKKEEKKGDKKKK